jgi:hypothetical protein
VRYGRPILPEAIPDWGRPIFSKREKLLSVSVKAIPV